MKHAISIQGLNKVYKDGFQALKNINLNIKQGEIFALLGPNGAGKTTLIGAICGIINPSAGKILVNEFDIIDNFKEARSLIGLVPQELTTDAFETVLATVTFSRGLFGKAPNSDYIEKILKDLSLWDKKDNRLRTLSGGMKRRVMIAKALSHEPQILFLDEPTAGVDVELRQDMWKQVHALRESGVTVILTTHYIDEAEEMADRIGVINKGEIILVENKKDLMKKLGMKELTLDLQQPLTQVPEKLKSYGLKIEAEGYRLVYCFETTKGDNGIADLLDCLKLEGLAYKDLNTKQSSLEDIFVQLVKRS